MTDTPSGIVGGGKSSDMLLAIQRLPFESKAMPRTPIPARNDSALDGSSAGNRTTVSDWALLTQTRFWASMATPKGDFNPLHEPFVLHSSAGEIEHLVLRGVGDPHVAVRGDAHALQSADLSGEGEIALVPNWLTVEVHQADRPVQARDPDLVQRDRSALSDAVDAHAGEARERWGPGGSVGGDLDCATADIVGHARLRAGHPVLAAPEVAVGVEHELAVGEHAAAREAEHQSEVRGSIGIRTFGACKPLSARADGAKARKRRIGRDTPSPRF